MKRVTELVLKDGGKEELLPGFTREFPYIMSCAELDKYREPVVDWHWHGAVELFYMESGCLEYTTPNGSWVFPEGSGGFINANVLHTSRTVPSGGRTVQKLHIFDPSFVAGGHGSRMEETYVWPLTGSGAEVIPLLPQVPEQAAVLKEVCGTFEISEREWGYEFRLRESLSRIWLMLYELGAAQKEPQNRGGSDGLVKDLMAYIQAHYAGEIRVEQLAEYAHISKRACFRLFQENLHMTPLEYIRQIRLRRAAQMLAEGTLSITRVAGECGLGTSSYFGKVFREEYGCTPGEYRRKWHDRDKI